MSGTRATFTVAADTRIEEGAVKAALEDKGLKYEGFRQETRPRPMVRYLVQAEGLG